jgi:hypothetical protein
MAKLNIPERYRPGVSMIRQLTEADVREIRAALDGVLTSGASEEDLASNKKLGDIATAATASVTHANVPDLKQVGEALVALYAVKAMRDVSIEEFADRVSDAMESLDQEKLRLPRAEREQFKQKLITLLSADVFGLMSKVLDLRTDDERVFCHARILTDLRPVFGSRIEDGPKGMVVVHLLKIGYHAGSEDHHEFFVSLDMNDLQTLRKLIDRAEAKAKSLKSAITDVRLFGIAKE